MNERMDILSGQTMNGPRPQLTSEQQLQETTDDLFTYEYTAQTNLLVGNHSPLYPSTSKRGHFFLPNVFLYVIQSVSQCQIVTVEMCDLQLLLIIMMTMMDTVISYSSNHGQ